MPGTQEGAGQGRPIEGQSGDSGDQAGSVPIDRSSRPSQSSGENGHPNDALIPRRGYMPLRPQAWGCRAASFLGSAQTA
jgi:hypothetical protein